MKAAVIFTYIPSPYRTIVFDELHKENHTLLQVVYMSKGDDKFQWNTEALKHDHLFWSDRSASRNPIMLGWHIWKYLNELNPKAVITCGFTVPMLWAMVWAFIKRRKRIVNTDAWEKIEEPYSFMHKWIRKWIFPTVHAAIPVSHKGREMFEKYGVCANRIFISHYAIDNDFALLFAERQKQFHIMFSGQMIERKMPFFFCDIARELKKDIPNLKVLILGSGELKDAFLARLNEDQIDFEYPGFIQPKELHAYYASSFVFLFPTLSDSWGVVANDAMAVGTPVLTCDNAGCANELVIDEVNGWVKPLNINDWVVAINRAIRDSEYYFQLRQKAFEQIKEYHPKKAAEQLEKAILFVLSEGGN